MTADDVHWASGHEYLIGWIVLLLLVGSLMLAMHVLGVPSPSHVNPCGPYC